MTAKTVSQTPDRADNAVRPDRLMRLESAARALGAILRGRPEVTGWSLDEALKVTEATWVFSGEVNGAPVVVKRFLGEGAARTVEGLKGELDYLERLFGDGPYQANRCLHAWPEQGVAVLSFVPGPRLGDRIATLEGAARRHLLTESGAWLAAYTAPRRRQATFGPRHWLKRLDSLDIGAVPDADRALLAELRQSLEGQVGQVRGCPVVQAATHGDFVGINAHVHDGVIYGVDIQGECWLPLAREAARFLVWQQIHDDRPPGETTSGISAEDWAAFLRSGLLDPSEIRTTLPFFVGCQLYARLVENAGRPAIAGNARRAMSLYLRP